ncbi:hypothetical protein [Jatrophihabitans sp.]|uniref:sialidase family protein n=1 Tax=Jatrophihabitans sp. TaxID=1932789 RepID=UPI0030C7784D
MLVLLVVVTGCTARTGASPSGHLTGSPPIATSPTTPATSGSASSSSAQTAGAALPDGSAGPQSISFVTADEGWALSPGSCTGCARISHTTNAGAHWTTLTSTLHLPASRDTSDVVEGLAELDFLNHRDGYLFITSSCSSGCGLVTTDGGHTWGTVLIPEPGMVVNGSHSLYALTHGPELLRIAIGGSHATTLPLPRVHTTDLRGYTIAAGEDTLAVLQVGSDLEGPLRNAGDLQTPAPAGALWISTLQGDRLTRVTDPCRNLDGGAAAVSVALDHPNALLLDCYNGQQSSQEASTQNHLYGSGDDGHDWSRLADPSDTGAPGLLADNGNFHAFFVSEGGEGYELHVSLDGGAHWHLALRGGSGGYNMAGPDFLTPEVGFALGPTHYAPEHLYRTIDAGRTWQQLSLPDR